MPKGRRGVRLHPEQDERTRAKIQTSQIINRLSDFVFGRVEMLPHQVTAALGLLRKVIPDLQTTEHKGSVEHFVVQVPTISATSDEWQQQHTPPLKLQ